MLFNTLQFAIFFAAVWSAYRTLPARWRNPLLLAASLLFYTLWIPSYLLLLLVDVGVNFALLHAVARSRKPFVPLVASIVFTLGLLAFFKYAAFLVEAALPVLVPLLGSQPALPEIFLPLGISFYSFQILALTIDVYRGRIEPPRSLAQYTLFICFFPQLIAGPILRGSEFLPQLERGGRPSRELNQRGLWLLATGLLKKGIFADFLLSPFVEQVFATPGVASAPFHWIALYSFAFQIYFDFSGYTDMARGLGCLLGFELPLNFREPYLSRNPAEFWRRWHITLSQWLRDYLYVPLGGNRRGSLRTAVNLGLTMLLGGLWHGAAWNFVIWGGLHGLLLIGHRLATGRRAAPDADLRWRDGPRILLQFHAVCLLWVFFRAASFKDAVDFLAGLFGGGSLVGWPVFQTGVVGLAVLLHGVERWLRLRAPGLRAELGAFWWGGAVEGAVVGAIVGLAFAVGGTSGAFIYFQF